MDKRIVEARKAILEIAKIKEDSIENAIALVAMEYAESYLAQIKKETD